MSMPHNFTDDPNSFSGPPTNSSNTTVILVAIAIVCGTLMLICGGVIFGVVTTVRQAQQDFQVTMGDQPWEGNNDPSAFQEYSGFVASGRYSEAIESVDSSLESDPDNAFLHNNKAWILATCPDDTVRDGKLAVEHATKACDLTNWANFSYVDTVAAAHAEAGDFEAAVKWQEEAIRLCDDTYKQSFQQRLRLYKAGKAYREGVPPYKDTIDDPMAEEQLLKTEGSDAPAIEASETTTADGPAVRGSSDPAPGQP